MTACMPIPWVDSHVLTQSMPKVRGPGGGWDRPRAGGTTLT